ncbi:MAG: alanyl-tRNA editing protein, partial [candidate division Zixibacteria bacterium]|nr:alanyl-tRNA editing protein [candidate division Zixibacteria bacterium]
MTDRLYYRDSSVLSFEGTIVECGEHEGRWYTILDRSAFYPTSGGQQHDLGCLGDVDIVDVVEGEDAAVRHISNKPVGDVGDTVSGEIDRERRRRHQQQHTAQHILSQALVRLWGFDTLSVHLGEDYGTIEFAAAEITAEQLELVESFCNDVITRNLPVTISFVEDADLADVGLRRPTARTGKIRVVSVGDIDVSACGGTHCSATGEVALLKIT